MVALHAWARSAEIARRLYGRAAACIAVGTFHLGARLDSLVLLAGARVLERRRSVALRELGEAVYAGDEASSEQLLAYLAAVDSEIARRKEKGAALRAGAGEHATRALSSARATEIREPGPGPPTPVPEPGPAPSPEPVPEPHTPPVPPRIPEPMPEPHEPPVPPGSP